MFTPQGEISHLLWTHQSIISTCQGLIKFLPPYILRELESNPGPLALQLTMLTTRPWMTLRTILPRRWFYRKSKYRWLSTSLSILMSKPDQGRFSSSPQNWRKICFDRISIFSTGIEFQFILNLKKNLVSIFVSTSFRIRLMTTWLTTSSAIRKQKP